MVDDRATGAWRALEAAHFDAACALFEAVLGERPDDADALDGYGLARWFAGDLDEGVVLRERAFERFARAGDCDRAARAAVWVSRQYLRAGCASASGGWLARAVRALAGTRGCAGEGWVVVERARQAATVGEAADGARRALAIAREHDDGELEVFALSVLGRAEVAAGRLEEGTRLLDEAMAAATAGRARNLHTLGEAYCNLIIACTAAGDWARAREWCRYVDEFAERRGIVVLYGACRTVHADVLVATGRWDAAEAALADALDAHRRRYPPMAAPTVSALALLRIRQGRLAEAQQLLAGREEEPSSLLALAELQLAEGEPRAGASLLERALAASHGDVLGETRVRASLVDAYLACGDVEAARSEVEGLRAAAVGVSGALVAARADLAAAKLALAEGRADDAAAHARAALEAFGALEMPHDAADARVELARSLASELPELARDEARAAFSTYEKLGALRGIDAAAVVLRDLGVPATAAARRYGELTPREREVLSLVARGLTNAGIARALFISEKTAGHHVSRILSKLGARNRAEAAAQAARLEVE